MFILLSVCLFIHVLVRDLAVSSGPSDYLQMSTHANSALGHLLCTSSVFSLSLCYVHLLQSVLTFLWHKSCKKAGTFSFPYSCFWVCRHPGEWRWTKKALTQAYTRTTGELELRVYVFIVLVVVSLVRWHFNCLELAAWAPSPEYLADAKEGRQEQSEPRLTYGS